MRNKILILLLLFGSYCFGQSVPNTETFSLQNVYDAVDNHTPATTTDLQSCFTNAISGYFNATYNQDSYAPANSMLRFRDYKPSGECISEPAYTYPLFGTMTTDNCGVYNLTPSFSAACSAYAVYIDWRDNNNSMGCMNTLLLGPSFGGYVYRSIVTIAVGVQLYEETGPSTGIWCPTTDTGYYINQSNYIVYIISGVIQSITACP